MSLKINPQWNTIDFRDLALNATATIKLLYDGVRTKEIAYTDKITKESKTFTKYISQVEYEGNNVYINNLTPGLAEKLGKYGAGVTLTVTKVDNKNWFDVAPFVDVNKPPTPIQQPLTTPDTPLKTEDGTPIPMQTIRSQLTPQQQILYDEVMTSKIVENGYTHDDWHKVGDTIPWK